MTVRTAHPSSAILAAFVDGRLSGKDHHQVVEHLASCAECFEVVAETAEVQEDLDEEAAAAQEIGTATDPSPRVSEGEPLPENVVVHPRAWKRWAPAAALMAAALAVAVVGGWQMGWFFGDPLAVDRLAGGLAVSTSQLSDQVRENRGWPTFRSGDPALLEEKAASFRTGTLALDLELALQALERARAARLAEKVAKTLEDVPSAPMLPSYYRQQILEPLESNQPMVEVRQASLIADQMSNDLLWKPYYEFGKWAEAGRLAALAKASGPLRTAAYRALVEDFLKEEEIAPEVSRRLEDIQARLQENLTDKDLAELASAFYSIVAGEGVRIREEPPEPELPSDTTLPKG